MISGGESCEDFNDSIDSSDCSVSSAGSHNT